MRTFGSRMGGTLLVSLLAMSLLVACGPAPAPAPTTKPAAAPTTAPAAPKAAEPTKASAAAPTAAAKAEPAKEASPAQLTKVRVGWTVAPHQALAGVALKKGWFKEAGLDVELIAFDKGAPLFEAMGAGKLDMGMSGSTPPISVAAAGAVPLYLVGTHAESTELFTMISRKDIKDITELKGKTGITAKGSVNHYFLAVVLEKVGLTEKDITLIHMEQVDAVTAFIANQGDFASLGTAFFPQILEKSDNTKILITGKDLPNPPGKPLKTKLMELHTVHKPFADENPDAVTKYIDVLYNRTHAYFNDESTKATARQELADWLKTTVNINQSVEELSEMLEPANYYSAEEQLKMFQDDTFKVSIDTQVNYLVDTNRIKNRLEFASWANPKFVEAASKK
jgi:ABC-type nitrate/sulfonate/bicarbonate transport system substrate-binding protein